MFTAYDVAGLLLKLACRALERRGCDNVDKQYVALGALAWDTCNQLTVSPERVYRSISFPAEATDREWCMGGLIAVQCVITLTRCAPTQDDAGNAPTAEQLSSAHSKILTDAAVLWNVGIGELPDDEWERAIVSQQFLGNEGGIIAIETRLTLGLDFEQWCP